VRWVEMTCLDCRTLRRVRRLELDRVKQPRCLRCGGPLEISAAHAETLGAARDAQRGTAAPKPARGMTPAPRLIPGREDRHYEFWNHPDLYGWCKRDAKKRDKPWKEGLTPEEFYGPQGIAAQTYMHQPDEEIYASGLIYETECKLFASGRPYYKIWPGIAAALCDTEMRIPGRSFALPFSGIEIRFPKTDNPMAPVCACVCCRVDASKRGDTDRDWSFVVAYFDHVEDFDLRDDAGTYFIADIPIRANELLEDSLSQTRLIADCPDPDLVRRLVRVCVGVCFFGMDAHELILPDLQRQVIDHYQSERRQPTQHEAEKALARAKKFGLFGWKVGSEVDLPRPRKAYQDRPACEQGEDEDDARELTASHVRRGHLRLQGCGPGRKEERVVFVRPSIIRPDLPLKSAHGFRVGKPQ